MTRVGICCLSENGLSKALLIAFVVPDLPVLRRPVRPRVASPIGASCSSRIVQALASTSFILAALYFWFPGLIIGRGVFLIAVVLVIALVVGWRLAFEWLSAPGRRRASGCCSSAPSPAAVDAGARAVRAAPRARRRDRRLRRSRSGAASARR